MMKRVLVGSLAAALEKRGRRRQTRTERMETGA